MHEDLIQRLRAEADAWDSGDVSRLFRESAAALEAMQAWRDTVDEMLTVQHEIASDDPRESINRLINWHVSVALDPCVSSDAQALIEQGAADAQADARRYRWLRDVGDATWRPFALRDGCSAVLVDAAIDAAMSS